MKRSKAQYGMIFAVIFALSIVVFGAALYGLERIAPHIIGTPAFAGALMGGGVVALIIPFSMIARVFVTHENRSMRFFEGWSLTFLFTLIAIVLVVVLRIASNLAIYGTAGGTFDWRNLNSDLTELAQLAAISFVVILFLFRILLWTGMRSALRWAERN
ncbi:hypothetical protein [Pseudaestuariivita rosea]|uniref:hypothetical protein n=1 Tax=Pseudaestuariivita rosea TaxID=2763263 RepID=UPI001ABAE52A|nr:hypothetical protein [Pseudaestuariivita rosea]